MSPDGLEGRIRPALPALGLGCADERLVRQGERFRELLVLQAGAPEPRDEVERRWGRSHFTRDESLLRDFLADVRRRHRKSLQRLVEIGEMPDGGALASKLAMLDAAVARCGG